jgi:septal ring factor EnvC (AmiA/AmiB activator)
MLEAARAQRSELRNQLERAEDQRQDLRQELTQTSSGDGVARAGLEARIRDTDARIASLDKEIAVADQRVAQAASVPGATYQPPRPREVQQGPPEEFWVLGGMFIIFVMMPMAIAFSRRLWKRAAVAVSNEVPAELTDRLSRMEQAIDAVAVELERVGEGQRYVTRVFTEQQRALGSGAAEPIEVRQREAIHQSRP